MNWSGRSVQVRWPAQAGWVIYQLLAFLMISCSQQALAGKYAGAFLEMGVGARALGLGSAYGAATSDGTAFYWNPAGLAILRRPEFNFMYTSQFGNFAHSLADYNYAGLALPLVGEATLAANWVRLSVDDIPVYSELAGDNLGQRLRNPSLRPDGKPLGYFSDWEDAFFFSFAKMNRFDLSLGWLYVTFPVEIPFGVNFKLIRQRMFGFKGSGLGVDAGAMLRLGLNDFFDIEHLGHLSVGLAVQDLAQTTISWSTKHKDRIARNVRFGVAYRQGLGFLRSAAVLAYGHESRYDGSSHYGLEWVVRNFSLRLGSCDGRLTAGAGFAFWRLRLDYAWVSYELGNVHRISGAVVF